MAEKQKFTIFINELSGTVLNLGQDAIEEMIAHAGLPVAAIHFLKPDSLINKIQSGDYTGPILIGGGDGTLKSCAQHLIESQIAFGILPLGTMNLLARDLGIPPELEAAITAYGQGTKASQFDAAFVNEECFLCCASIGTIPETSNFREQHRTESQPVLVPLITAYMLKQLDKSLHLKLHLSKGKKTRRKHVKSAALIISNNQYNPNKDGQWSEENFRRTSLQDGILGVYTATPLTVWDKMRLMFRVMRGDWKNDQALREWNCDKLRVESYDKQELLIALDGETQTIKAPLDFIIKPGALKIMLPLTA